MPPANRPIRPLTERIDFDFGQAPQKNAEYFFPLEMQIDPKEKASFIDGPLKELRVSIEKNKTGLSNVADVNDLFPETIKSTNEFLSVIGLRTRAMTLFLCSGDYTCWAPHCDGTRYQNKPTLLEARLSYYEIAESPGAIRWWDDSVTAVLTEHAKDEYSQNRVSAIVDWAEKIRNGELSWKDVPQPAFSTVTSAPSAILRTNRAHHVIQGPGLRVTASCQLVFLDGNPTGVWEHIQKNKHLIGV